MLNKKNGIESLNEPQKPLTEAFKMIELFFVSASLNFRPLSVHRHNSFFSLIVTYPLQIVSFLQSDNVTCVCCP